MQITNPFKRKPKDPSKQIFRYNDGKLIVSLSPLKLWKGTALIFIFLFAFTQVFGLNLNLVGMINTDTVKASKNISEKIVVNKDGDVDLSRLQEQVLPTQGIVIPIKWGDLGKQLVDTGVIDSQAFESIYANRGGLGDYEKQLLYGNTKDFIKMDEGNSQFLLNLLWAFGLGNKNIILDNGPMQDERYGGAGGFASTGGWSLAKGDPMDHYSHHSFITLSANQQKMVENVSKGIYRPCCGNSTYFPDCNHGMAMLGLLELLAFNGASESQMYKTALEVNSFWFPSTYLTIAKYFAGQGVSWDKVDPKVALSANYSSAGGYKQVQAQVEPATVSGGGGCGV